jgi:hypothetical protein
MTRLNLQSRIATERQAAQLAAGLEKNLSAYATAATAAGIGILMTALPATAKIVYTPSNIPITTDGTPVPLDINNDGIPDFGFSNIYTIGGGPHRPPEGTHGGFMGVFPAQKNNAIWEVSSHKVACAAALNKGVKVGPKAPLEAKSLLMAASHGNYTNGGSAYGPWVKVTQGYLGVKFAIHGKMHYGWARIKWSGVGSTAYVTGYAYETVANKAIITGKTKGPADKGSTNETADTSGRQTGSLGQLARGTAGVMSGPSGDKQPEIGF